MDAQFWHFNLGNLLTILSFIVGGIWFVATMRSEMKELASLTNLRLTHLEAASDDQKEEIKKLALVLITLGKYEERFLRVEGMIDDLRHGRGIIRENHG